MSSAIAAAVGGAVVGGIMSNKASSKASKSARASNQDTLDAQLQMYETGREDFAPYTNLGQDAMPTYYKMLGITPTLTDDEQWLLAEAAKDPLSVDQVALQNAKDKQQMINNWDGAGTAPELSPLGQWQLQQGNTALGRADSARGIAGGGSSATRQANLASSVAASDYQNSYSRILDALGLGQSSAAGASANAAGASSAIGTAGALNQANILDQGQSQANMWSGLGQLPGQAMTAYQNAKGPSAPVSPIANGGFSNFSPGAAATSQFLGGSSGLLI